MFTHPESESRNNIKRGGRWVLRAALFAAVASAVVMPPSSAEGNQDNLYQTPPTNTPVPTPTPNTRMATLETRLDQANFHVVSVQGTVGSLQLELEDSRRKTAEIAEQVNHATHLARIGINVGAVLAIAGVVGLSIAAYRARKGHGGH